MTTVTFTRRFVNGNLVGLTHDDRISFPDYASAFRWLAGILRNKALNYRLECFSVGGDHIADAT